MTIVMPMTIIVARAVQRFVKNVLKVIIWRKIRTNVKKYLRTANKWTQTQENANNANQAINWKTKHVRKTIEMKEHEKNY